MHKTSDGLCAGLRKIGVLCTGNTALRSTRSDDHVAVATQIIAFLWETPTWPENTRENVANALNELGIEDYRLTELTTWSITVVFDEEPEDLDGLKWQVLTAGPADET